MVVGCALIRKIRALMQAGLKSNGLCQLPEGKSTLSPTHFPHSSKTQQANEHRISTRTDPDYIFHREIGDIIKQ
ncbi:hypothetical protein J6590_080131 [Homalodisca vitripennis]|nr:hypothetical protein J6590_080131 [Homalodisca vitripennis]